MRAVLAFSIIANPTYIPLGTASLSSYIKASGRDISLKSIDLNVATWNWLIDQKSEHHPFREFMQGRYGYFYDEVQYKKHQLILKELFALFEQYNLEARFYLERNTLTSELQRLLLFQSNLVLENEPELIGFSIMYPKQVVFTLALAKFIHSANPFIAGYGKETANPKIILGGAMISALQAEDILSICPFIEAVFDGEGEDGLKMLCEGGHFSEIPGLIYRAKGNIVRNRKTETISLAKVPLPEFADFNLNMYLSPEPVVPVAFSRGCKWRKCRFCAHNFSYSGYRKRNTVQFVEYLSRLKNESGIRHFYFADQYIDAADIKNLAEEIVKNRLDIFYHIMGRPTDDYNPEIFEKLFKSGCRWISWGIESGSQRLLDICRKGTNVESLHRIVRDSNKAGISNLLMLIFGLPTSTEEDFNGTIKLLDDLEESTDAITSSNFQLFDGTAFSNRSKEFGIKVIGRERIFSIANSTLYSNRLFYREQSSDGTTRPPRGPLEIERLERRRLWTGSVSIFEDIYCEHYLLYAAHLKSSKGCVKQFHDNEFPVSPAIH
ncbi:MAG: radical SAM protein [Sedimentisphaerales bacterium]|nr:radical SAM protein [Sedimentisphaerales bacterium]